MSQPLQEGFSYGAFVPGGWYSIGLYRELFQVIRSVSGEAKELVHEIGRQCTRDDMNGIYRVLVKLIAPETLFSLGQRMFSNYYSVGKVVVVESRTGFTHVRWSDCRGFDDNLWTEVMGACEQLLEIGGAVHVRLRTVAGGQKGDEQMEATAHWS